MQPLSIFFMRPFHRHQGTTKARYAVGRWT